VAIRERDKGMTDAIVVLVIGTIAIVSPIVLAVWIIATAEVHDPMATGGGTKSTD
jgi:hypothetical protein